MIFTYDISRPQPEEYRYTAQWLADAVYHLFKLPAQTGTKLPVARFTEETHPECKAIFYEGATGKEPTFADWAQSYHAVPSPRFVDYMDRNLSHSLVVGFELPPSMKEGLTALDIPYLDCVIYPIRFLDDLIFGFSTNDSRLEAVLKSYSIPEPYFQAAAALQRARYAPSAYTIRFPGRTLMLIGQSAFDKAVISKCGLPYSLSAYAQNLMELAQAYDYVVFRPHPFHAPPADLEVLRSSLPTMRVLPDSEFPHLNMYAYLAHPQVSTFVGLNSSVLFEAAYFEKQGISFAQYEYNFPGKQVTTSEKMCWPVRHCFQAVFWHHCLETFASDELSTTPTWSLPEPYLRLILRGAGDFDDARSYTQCLKIAALEQRCTLLENR